VPRRWPAWDCCSLGIPQEHHVTDLPVWNAVRTELMDEDKIQLAQPTTARTLRDTEGVTSSSACRQAAC
jgi:hypothetical protein